MPPATNLERSSTWDDKRNSNLVAVFPAISWTQPRTFAMFLVTQAKTWPGILLGTSVAWLLRAVMSAHICISVWMQPLVFIFVKRNYSLSRRFVTGNIYSIYFALRFSSNANFSQMCAHGSFAFDNFTVFIIQMGRSRWPRGLRHGSAAVHLLGFRVRMSPGP